LYYSDIKAFEQNAGQALPEVSLIPAQSCVTLTEGWFWKQGDENRPLKSAETVVEKWLKPQNKQRCNLICNAAPGRDGRFAPNIIARLEEIGKLYRAATLEPVPKLAPSMVITTTNLATGQPIRAVASDDTYGPDMINDGNFRNSWYLPAGRTEGWVEVDMRARHDNPHASKAEQTEGRYFNTVVIAEPIGRWKDYPTSRISRYKLEAWEGNAWSEILAGNSTEAVRIRAIPRTRAAKVRLMVWTGSEQPHLSEFGLYDEPQKR
jgi:alpha-L-fucosidase